MISANCDILEFIPEQENKNYFEMIDLNAGFGDGPS
jgi:hypothetical protein